MYRNCIVILNNLRKEPLFVPCIRLLTLSMRTWLAQQHPYITLNQALAPYASLLGLKDILYNYLVNLSYQMQIVQEYQDGVLDSDYAELAIHLEQLIEERRIPTLRFSSSLEACDALRALTNQREFENVGVLPSGIYDPLQIARFLVDLQPLLCQLYEWNQNAVTKFPELVANLSTAITMNWIATVPETKIAQAQLLLGQLRQLNSEFHACYTQHEQSVGEVTRDVRDLLKHYLEPQFQGIDPTLEQLVAQNTIPTPEFALRYEQFSQAFCELFDRNQPFERLLGYSEILRIGKLELNSACLIPRFDTYNLICEAFGKELRTAFVQFLMQRSQTGNTIFRILDLGAGTGLMGLSLLEHLLELFAPNCTKTGSQLACCTPPPNIQIELHFVDLNPQVLAMAVHNAQQIYQKFAHVSIYGHLSDWYSNLPDQLRSSFQVILSNPPYLAPHDPHFWSLLDDEPQMALVAPENGLAFYRTIIAQARQWLAPQGILCLEHGHTQSRIISGMFDAQWSAPQVGYDLGTTTKRGLLSRLLH